MEQKNGSPSQEKQSVSPEWTAEERLRVVYFIARDMVGEPNPDARKSLLDLLGHAVVLSPEALEINRGNYLKYVTEKPKE